MEKINWNWGYIKTRYPKTYNSLIKEYNLSENRGVLVDDSENLFDYLNLKSFMASHEIYYAVLPTEKRGKYDKHNKVVHFDIVLFKLEDSRIKYQEKLELLDTTDYDIAEAKALLETNRLFELFVS